MRLAWLLLLPIAFTACSRKAGESCAATGQCDTGLTCCSGVCADTKKDFNNCGACGTACAAVNGSAICASGSCKVACQAGWGNCNGDASDGCETDVTSTPGHCGSCSQACTYTNADATCGLSHCALGACKPGFADCDGRGSTGCEVNTATDGNHCGGCGMKCTLPHSSPRCANSACVVGTCDPGFGDCDNTASNGCETDTTSSSQHCGGCGQPCASGLTCVSGTCKPSELLLFGGFPDMSGSTASSTTWRFGLVSKTWSQVQVDADGGVPDARGGHAAAWDGAGNRMLVFGGGSSSGAASSDLWALDFSTDPPSWSIVTTTGTAPSSRMAMASGWDPVGRKWYLFGGLTDLVNPTPLSDLAVFDAATNTWSAPTTSSPPPARGFCAGAWDADSGRFVVYGGNDGTFYNNELSDTWTLDPTASPMAWQQLTTVGGPGGRLGSTFFEGVSPLVLFGGSNDWANLPVFFQDLQSLNVGTPAWATITAAGAPSVRMWTATATSTGKRYLYGGVAYDSSFTEVDSYDTWRFDPPSSWVKVHAGTTTHPEASNGASMVGRQ